MPLILLQRALLKDIGYCPCASMGINATHTALSSSNTNAFAAAAVAAAAATAANATTAAAASAKAAARVSGRAESWRVKFVKLIRGDPPTWTHCRRENCQ